MLMPASKMLPVAPIANTASATPRLAPELMPRMKGSASGLRNIVCICKPATESAAPASAAVSALVSRKLRMMVVQLALRVGLPSKIPKTSLSGMDTDPRLRLTTNAATRISANKPKAQLRVEGLRTVGIIPGRASMVASV